MIGINVSLNPLKTRKSFRRREYHNLETDDWGLNPLKTRKSFRLTTIKNIQVLMIFLSLNPLKTRKSFRPQEERIRESNRNQS